MTVWKFDHFVERPLGKKKKHGNCWIYLNFAILSTLPEKGQCGHLQKKKSCPLEKMTPKQVHWRSKTQPSFPRFWSRTGQFWTKKINTHADTRNAIKTRVPLTFFLWQVCPVFKKILIDTDKKKRRQVSDQIGVFRHRESWTTRKMCGGNNFQQTLGPLIKTAKTIKPEKKTANVRKTIRKNSLLLAMLVPAVMMEKIGCQHTQGIFEGKWRKLKPARRMINCQARVVEN